MLDTLYNGFAGLVGTLNDLMYSYVLIILLLAAGVYFTIRTAGVQVRLLGESVRVVSEKSGDTKAVSAFEALMVSTASRVGTGNIVGVANAIAIGGYGSVFWMWLIALVGGATALSRARSRRSIKSAAPRAAATAAVLLYPGGSRKPEPRHYFRDRADRDLCDRLQHARLLQPHRQHVELSLL